MKFRDTTGYSPSSSSLSLILAEDKVPYGKVVHPWPDHTYPLHIVLGTASEGYKTELIHHS
jgi:hypothetical protein